MSSIGLEGLLSKASPITRVSGDSAFEPDEAGPCSDEFGEQNLGQDLERSSRLSSLGEFSWSGSSAFLA